MPLPLYEAKWQVETGPPSVLARFLLRQGLETKLTQESPVLPVTRPAAPVLVVEDDREQRESLCAMLDFEGFDHAEACNGQEALDYLDRSRAPCVVLLDLDMPVMNGWVFRAQQLADGRLSSIPVVVVTANNERLKDRFPGVAGFLYKPLDYEKLAAVLELVCRRDGEATTPASA
jgi:CheY-like chemotaxis protein